MEPVTGYAQLAGERIAFQIVGAGTLDLVVTAGYWGSFDVEWENPAIRLFYQRLASFARVIRFDRRGTGSSDPLPLDGLPPWESYADEIEAVLDAAGSEKAALLAVHDAGPVGLLFAATRPQRTAALILFNTTARFIAADDYPIGLSREDYEAMVQTSSEDWGTSSESLAEYFLPSLASDPRALQWMTKVQRSITGPTAVAQYAMASTEADARSLLSSVEVPTLVIHRIDSGFTPLSHGRYLAENIAEAEFVEIEGGDNVPYFENPEATIDVLRDFLADSEPRTLGDRVLASLLFTDIVDSTKQAEGVGDEHWKALLDLHDDISQEVAAAYGGHLVKNTGDGILALFDGPGRAIRAADQLRQQLQDSGLPIRAGIHTGEVELRGDDVSGIAVHLAARVMAESQPGELLVTSTVRDLVAGSGIKFTDHGLHSLKGIEEARHLYSVEVGSRR